MTEKLWHAVGALPGGVLAGSDEENVRRVFRARKKRMRTMFTTLAACLCICVIAGTCLLPVIFGGHYNASKSDPGNDSAMSSGDQMAAPEPFVVGKTLTARGASLTLLSCNGEQAVFRLENAQDVESTHRVTVCAVSEAQMTVHEAGDGFTVLVDGSAAPDGALPGARGTYEIIVDLSGWQAENGTPTILQIENFGRFALPGA